jgi:methyltransferase family protein
MIYRSNILCPDLTPHFKHLISRPMAHSFGHDVPSDWGDKAEDDPVFGIYKRCGLWTHDEAAILWNARFRQSEGPWVDIGAHTGWTTMHAGCGLGVVDAVEPMLGVPEFADRFRENTHGSKEYEANALRSDQYFSAIPRQWRYAGFVIDGDHEPDKPLEDAMGAAKHLSDDGIIIFHDFIGQPVREAVQYLLALGFHCRVYFTPHMVALCWRGDYQPPEHASDPNLPDLKSRCPDFDFTRCE